MSPPHIDWYVDSDPFCNPRRPARCAAEQICAPHERWDPEKFDFLPDLAQRYRG